MKFTFAHSNIHVSNLDESLEFYKNALGLTETSRIIPEDGSFIIVHLGDGHSDHKLELTRLRDWDKPYNLGDNKFHLAFFVDDFFEALKKHREMGCIAYEKLERQIYFIHDPDGYLIEVLSNQK
jgi:lactoylglutathione lyase